MSSLRFPMFILLMALSGVADRVIAQDQAKSKPPITALAIAPDGAQIITGSQAGVAILSWSDLKPLEKLTSELTNVHDAQFSPSGKQLLLAGGAPGEFGSLELWSWPEKKLVARAQIHTDVIYKAAWSPNSQQIITAGADGVAKVIEAKRLTPQATYEGHSRAILAATWLATAEQALTASVDQTIQLWSVADAKRIRSLSNHVAAVNDLALCPNRDDSPPILVSISEDRTIRLWQPTIGRLMRFAKLPSPPRVVKWDRTGEVLFVAGNDGVIRILDFDSLSTKREFSGEIGRIHELVLNPKEDFLLVAGERGIKSFDLNSSN